MRTRDKRSRISCIEFEDALCPANVYQLKLLALSNIHIPQTLGSYLFSNMKDSIYYFIYIFSLITLQALCLL